MSYDLYVNFYGVGVFGKHFIFQPHVKLIQYNVTLQMHIMGFKASLPLSAFWWCLDVHVFIE